MDQGDEDEWKGWQERERVDHWRKILMFGSAAFSIYPLSKFLDAIASGKVDKFRSRGRPEVYSLSGNADAYYVNTLMWAGFAAVFIGVAIQYWIRRKRRDAGPII